jgi:PAS domain S-box-containing protein
MSNNDEKIRELEAICERYELATSAANIGVYDWITSTDVVFYSKTWKSQIGYAEHELENNFDTWINLLHPDESEEVQQKTKAYIENPNGQYVNEFRFRHKNGSYIWILAKAEVLKDEQGNMIRMFGSHTDITLKKEIELKLEAIYNQSSEGITITDEYGKYVSVNPAFCLMSGYLEEELLKLTMFDLKSTAQDQLSFEKTIQRSKIINVVLKKKDGTEYFSEIIGDIIFIGNDKFVLRTVRDVTEKVLAEKRIKDLKDNLEELVKERTKELNAAVLRLNQEIEYRVIAEKKIKESLDLKAILLREITHRVKNNFQIICSLIRLQQRRLENPEVNLLLSQTAHRIQSMSLIHETLYRTNTFDDVIFKDYIRSLVKYIKTTSEGLNIKIIEEIDEFDLPIMEATNLGMIIMELITNAIKYAFPEEKYGEILIKMELLNGKHKLTFSDNGIGMPKGYDFRAVDSLGMQVIVSLTDQMEGDLRLLELEGTTFEIVF